jgi:Na+-transporting NADH:ubiquinone oxidoreductase subunit A
MIRHRIRRGLDVPVPGAPVQTVTDGRPVASVAVRGRDLRGLHPRVRVEPGQAVRLGDVLLEDRDHAGLVVTSPGAGVVRAVHRGERRALDAVVVGLSGDGEVAFDASPRAALGTLPREEVVRRLLASGLFVALRTRPFDRVPDPASVPRAVFVTATATDPLCARPDVVVAEDPQAFADGLAVVARLTSGPVYLCRAPDASLPEGDPSRVTVATFEGPHPAGLVGTHVHCLAPARVDAVVWHVGAQDVAAIGALFTTGRLRTARVVALGGPRVRSPRLVRTRLGASLDELLRDERHDGPHRTVSGSVLSGDEVAGPTAYLGRYHTQVAVLAPAPRPSRDRPVMWPLPVYARVVPLDLPVLPLLRALLVGDVERAEALGALELTEEDLALCGYVCPARIAYGPALRAVLDASEAGR